MNEVSNTAQDAVRDAAEAADNADQVRLILGVLKAQELMQAQHGHGCEHAHHSVRPRRSTGQILALTAAGCAACTVMVGLFLAIAVTAVAVGGSALAFLFVIRELRKGR